MQFEINTYEDFKRAIEDLCAFLCDEGIPEEKVFDSKLVAHELLANVLQHSTGGAVLHVQIQEGSIGLRLQAKQRFVPPACVDCPNEYAERGRGIFLVDRVSVERSVNAEGDILVKIEY